MVFSEDVKSVFERSGEEISGSEILLCGRSRAVISGHRGLAFLSPDAVTVRLRKGRVTLVGKDLRVMKASPAEIYVYGKINALEYPSEEAEG